MQIDCRHPERCVVGHPFNPPHLVPLVEVAGGEKTGPEAIERALAFYTAIGKQPIHIRREVPGDVANRLQAALWREALHLVRDGRETRPISPPVAIVAGGTRSTVRSTARRGWITHFRPLRF